MKQPACGQQAGIYQSVPAGCAASYITMMLRVMLLLRIMCTAHHDGSGISSQPLCQAQAHAGI